MEIDSNLEKLLWLWNFVLKTFSKRVKLFTFGIISLVNGSIWIGIYIDTFKVSLKCDNLTELATICMVFLRAAGYLIGFLLFNRSWESLLNRIGTERNSLRPHDGCWKLSLKHSRLAYNFTAFWFIIVLFGHFLINSLSVIVELNAYHLPINFYIVGLPFKGFSLNWAINYLYQVLASTFGACALLVSLPLMMFAIDHACWGLDATLLLLADFKNVPIEDELMREKILKDILDLITKVLEWQKDVQTLIGINFSMEFSLMGLIVCMSLYAFISGSMEVAPILATSLISLAQLFAYCYMGNRVIVRIEKLRDTAYETQWYQFDKGQQKSIQLIIRVSQYMKGFHGILNPLSMGTFQKVLEFSYSMIAVLIRATK